MIGKGFQNGAYLFGPDSEMELGGYHAKYSYSSQYSKAESRCKNAEFKG